MVKGILTNANNKWSDWISRWK